jgi:hypothetical protein
MSFEDVIAAVQARPEIWQSRHPLYKNRATGKKIWSEIAV